MMSVFVVNGGTRACHNDSSLVLAGEKQYKKLLSLSLDWFFKTLLSQVAFYILFFVAIFSLYFRLVGLLLQSVALISAREISWVLDSF